MSMDDLNNLTPESQESTITSPSLLTAEQSRRKFLRTAVIGTAGVAGAAGVAGVILSQQGARPNLMVVADIAGVSQSHFHTLFEDTNCGTSGDKTQCGDYSTTQFTINNGTSTSPGSFFIVLAIQGLPADTYSISAAEKLSTASSYSTVPNKGSGSASLPFEFQSPGGVSGASTQVYIYPTGTITGSGPYALTASPYNAPTTTSSGSPFTTFASQDVLIFIHVNWNSVTTQTSGTTETIDFQITLTGSGSNSATETTSTTGKWA